MKQKPNLFTPPHELRLREAGWIPCLDEYGRNTGWWSENRSMGRTLRENEAMAVVDREGDNGGGSGSD